MHGAEDFRGFSEVPMQARGVNTVQVRFHARQAQLAVRATSFSQHTNNHNISHILFLGSIKLVVVMSAVETWKVRKVRQGEHNSGGNFR